MTRPLKLGVVGCGFMGKTHLGNLRTLEAARPAALCDVDLERARDAAGDGGVPCFEDLERMLDRTSLDGLVVATPPTVRQDVLQVAAREEIPVYVEKPPATTPREYLRCDRLLREADLPNVLGFMYRMHPLVQEMGDYLEAGEPTLIRTDLSSRHYDHYDGSPMGYGYLRKAASGGVLCDQYVHLLDLARALMGDLTHVTAHGDRLHRPPGDAADLDDAMVLASRFGSRALGLHGFNGQHTEWRFEVTVEGTDFRLTLDLLENTLEGRFQGRDVHERRADFDAHAAALKEFVDRLSTGDFSGCPLPSYREIRPTMAAVFTGNRALETKRWEAVSIQA